MVYAVLLGHVPMAQFNLSMSLSVAIVRSDNPQSSDVETLRPRESGCDIRSDHAALKVTDGSAIMVDYPNIYKNPETMQRFRRQHSTLVLVHSVPYRYGS